MVEEKDYQVKVLIGAAEQLVRMRGLRQVYETNRDIKFWALYFLLKRISPNSGKIHHWIRQKDCLLSFCQMNENTFRKQLKELVKLGLATVDDGYSISLVSYRAAADILNIAYAGETTITYNPIKNAGKQTFQYLLRREEFRYQQERQLNAMLYYLDQNPLLKSDLIQLMIKHGAIGQQLYTNSRYFQERLLQLQMKMFREGSELLDHVLTRRADINRGVRRIQDDHAYRSPQSATYLKKRMHKLGIIGVQKKKVESAERSRLYVTEGNLKRDGYKYNRRKKSTVWFLTDQIIIPNEASTKKTGEERARKVA